MKTYFYQPTYMLLGLLFFSSTSLAESKSEFCERFQQPQGVIEHISKPENRLAFSNFGGKWNMGVCWWHSRLQRRASYLATFKPELSKPDEKEFRKIAKDLIYGARVVEIPGFKNLAEIKEKEYVAIFEDELSKQQIREAFFKLIFLENKIGGFKKGLAHIDHEIATIEETLRNGDIPYVLLRPKNIMNTHAWLVSKVEVDANGCKEITSIDSNYDDTVTVQYCAGALPKWVRGPTALYVLKDHELAKIKKAAKRYCE